MPKQDEPQIDTAFQFSWWKRRSSGKKNVKSFKTWLEAIDKVSDFLSVPNNRNKTFNEIIDDFQKMGGQVSNGKYGFVFSHHTWPYVIKVFKDDACYLKFARFAYSNPNPAFPKFYGPPQKMVPFYKHDPSIRTIYVSRIEKLFPLNDKQFAKEIFYWSYSGGVYFHQLALGRTEAELRAMPGFDEFFKFIDRYPETKSLYAGLYLLNKESIPCQFDESVSNIMKRQDGSLVWSDPLWYGESPYTRAREIEDMEIDRGGYNYATELPMLHGGELPKVTRKKKPKPKQTPISRDDILF